MCFPLRFPYRLLRYTYFLTSWSRYWFQECYQCECLCFMNSNCYSPCHSLDKDLVSAAVIYFSREAWDSQWRPLWNTNRKFRETILSGSGRKQKILISFPLPWVCSLLLLFIQQQQQQQHIKCIHVLILLAITIKGFATIITKTHRRPLFQMVSSHHSQSMGSLTCC